MTASLAAATSEHNSLRTVGHDVCYIVVKFKDLCRTIFLCTLLDKLIPLAPVDQANAPRFGRRHAKSFMLNTDE
jgi:hypothetical protein